MKNEVSKTHAKIQNRMNGIPGTNGSTLFAKATANQDAEERQRGERVHELHGVSPPSMRRATARCIFRPTARASSSMVKRGWWCGAVMPAASLPAPTR